MDCFGDAIEREPVRCYVMIREAPNSVTRAVTSGWVDRALGLSLCASAAAVGAMVVRSAIQGLRRSKCVARRVV